jgi:hypothetical protein
LLWSLKSSKWFGIWQLFCFDKNPFLDIIFLKHHLSNSSHVLVKYLYHLANDLKDVIAVKFFDVSKWREQTKYKSSIASASLSYKSHVVCTSLVHHRCHYSVTKAAFYRKHKFLWSWRSFLKTSEREKKQVIFNF